MITLYAMTIDTEEEWDWKSGWPTTNLALSNIVQLPKFQALCERYGVATTYFTNYAVMADAAARETVLRLAEKSRVEIGMHVHPWNTPPFDAQQPVTTRETYLHNLRADAIDDKLDTVYGVFKKSGLLPTSFRGGRYSSGGRIHDFLRRNGFIADSSVVPYTSWEEEGGPNYRERGIYPFRLAESNCGAPLWEIPLTLGFTRRAFGFWEKCYAYVGRTWLSKLHLVGVAEKMGLVRKVWLNFEEPLGRYALPFLCILREMQLPCICLTVHSSSLLAGVGPYTRTPSDEKRLFDQAETIFRTLSEWPEFQPATVTEIARTLESEHTASRGVSNAHTALS